MTYAYGNNPGHGGDILANSAMSTSSPGLNQPGTMQTIPLRQAMGPAYGGATGRTANFGYGTLGANRMPMQHSYGGGPMYSPAPVPRVLPNQEIGVPKAEHPGVPEGRQHSFGKGLGEGMPGIGALARGLGGLFGGGGGVAAAAETAAEAAPLAVAAL